MRLHRLLVIVILPVFLFAACGDEEGSPDGKDEKAIEDGKADSIYGECQVRQLLAWVNDPQVSEDDLREAGVHTRAARNIIEYRNGPDGVPGTEDDNYFDSPEELDDVSYVGPVAFQQLVDAIDHLCQTASWAEVIFSPQAYEESHLARVAELIDNSTTSIDIAMYSFSNSMILDSLERAVDRGVTIRFIFETANQDRTDPEGTWSAKLEDRGIDVRYINKIMHHKFAILDGPRESAESAHTAILATGSGNWSNSAATRYDENTVFLQGNDELLLRFQQEFNHLWEHSRDFVWNEDLGYFTSMTVNDEMIADDPTVDAAFTSKNFDTKITSYGNTFSVVAGRNEVANKLVELVQAANNSIWIASGHLRSRPVSEALLAKWEENPNMDIRVYLDGQEYISYSTYNDKVNELEDCLEEAGDSVSQQQKCLDKGFYFSYPVHDAGIPLKFKYYCYRWHYSYAEQMHHKYLIFDGATLATGSYNLSDNAEHNTMENMVVYNRAAYPDLVDAFIDNFSVLWVTGESDGLYDELMDLIQNSTAPIPIVFDSMALNQDQITELKSAIREACPAVNSAPYRENPQAHTVCYRD